MSIMLLQKKGEKFTDCINFPKFVSWKLIRMLTLNETINNLYYIYWLSIFNGKIN